MPLFVIDVLTSFRNKYIIEANELSHAYDEICMTEHSRDFTELTQKFLGESILEGKQISYEELGKLIETLKSNDDELCCHWLQDKLIHKIDYTK
jgi:hypothetical protein